MGTIRIGCSGIVIRSHPAFGMPGKAMGRASNCHELFLIYDLKTMITSCTVIGVYEINNINNITSSNTESSFVARVIYSSRSLMCFFEAAVGRMCAVLGFGFWQRVFVVVSLNLGASANGGRRKVVL